MQLTLGETLTVRMPVLLFSSLSLTFLRVKPSDVAERRYEDAKKVLESKQSAVDKISFVVTHLRLAMDIGESVAKVSSAHRETKLMHLKP